MTLKKITSFFLFASFFAMQGFSQAPTEVEYLSQLFKLTDKKSAYYTRVYEPTDKGEFIATVKDMKGSLRMMGTMVPMGEEMTEHGHFIFYYENGQVESEGYYEHGIKVGAWKRFTVRGSERPERYYKPESADFLRDVMAGK